MRLPNLIGFLSSLGASLIVGMNGVMATLPIAKAQTSNSPHSLNLREKPELTSVKETPLSNPIAPQNDSVFQATQQNNLQFQKDDLAENPLCRLAATTVTNPPKELNTGAAQVPAKFSGFVSGFLRKLVQVMGLERWTQQPATPIPNVTVMPLPVSQSKSEVAEKPLAAKSPVLLVSNHQTKIVSQERDYQLLVKGHPIANIRTQKTANSVAQHLASLIDTPSFDAQAIAPTLYQKQPAIMIDGQILIVVDESVTREDKFNHEVLAIQWANNLRIAFNVPALDLIAAQQKMYQIEETKDSVEGLASWYGPYFHGRQTANGETYDQYGFTAAHPSMPLDTYLKVTNLDNDKSVIIRLNDRGPYIQPRSLDLSLGAARCLNSVQTGVIPYKATIMKRRPAIASAAI